MYGGADVQFHIFSISALHGHEQLGLDPNWKDPGQNSEPIWTKL